jgi:hypothetical protein
MSVRRVQKYRIHFTVFDCVWCPTPPYPRLIGAGAVYDVAVRPETWHLKFRPHGGATREGRVNLSGCTVSHATREQPKLTLYVVHLRDAPN